MTAPAAAALRVSPPAAKRVGLAATLLVIYGLIVILNAALLQSAAPLYSQVLVGVAILLLATLIGLLLTWPVRAAFRRPLQT